MKQFVAEFAKKVYTFFRASQKNDEPCIQKKEKQITNLYKTHYEKFNTTSITCTFNGKTTIILPATTETIIGEKRKVPFSSDQVPHNLIKEFVEQESEMINNSTKRSIVTWQLDDYVIFAIPI